MQTVDFVALATRVAAGVEGIRACLMLSRDGLALGAYPTDGEARAKEAWNRLQAVGDAQRGFLDLGEEILAVVRRGPYVGVVVAGPDVRPGLVLDVLDANLHAAEEERSRQTTGTPEPASARPEPTRRRRPVPHSGPARRREAPAEPAEAPPSEPSELTGEAPAEPAAEAEAAPAASAVVDLSGQPAPSGGRWGARLRKLAGATAPVGEEAGGTAPAFEEAVSGPAAPEADEPAGTPPPKEPQRQPVDRSALAREFGRLLSDQGAGD